MPSNDERIGRLEKQMQALSSLADDVNRLVRLQTEDGPWRDNTKRWIGRLCVVQKLALACAIGGATTFGGFVAVKLWNIETGQRKLEVVQKKIEQKLEMPTTTEKP